MFDIAGSWWRRTQSGRTRRETRSKGRTRTNKYRSSERRTRTDNSKEGRWQSHELDKRRHFYTLFVSILVLLRNLQFWWKWSKIALYKRSTIAADRVVLVELTKQVPGSASTVRSPDQSSFVELFYSYSYYMGQQMNSCTCLTARSPSPDQKFYMNDIRGCSAFQNIAPTLWKQMNPWTQTRHAHLCGSQKKIWSLHLVHNAI